MTCARARSSRVSSMSPPPDRPSIHRRSPSDPLQINPDSAPDPEATPECPKIGPDRDLGSTWGRPTLDRRSTPNGPQTEPSHGPPILQNRPLADRG